jgi:hypothetical protein
MLCAPFLIPELYIIHTILLFYRNIIKSNLKQTLEIAESTADPRIKLQARAIANDCYKYIMELTTDGAIISDAMKHVESKVSKLKQNNTAIVTTTDKIKQVQNTEVEAATEGTTNGVF